MSMPADGARTFARTINAWPISVGFDLGRVLGNRVGLQICTEMWFFE
jgi:hypothetical protein